MATSTDADALWSSNIQPEKENKHIKADRDSWWMFMSFFAPLIICGISLGLHFGNSCVWYATGLFWSVTGVYMFSLVTLIITVFLYYELASFCAIELLHEQRFDLAALYFSIASTLSWYDFYTYNANGFAALAACLQFSLTLFLFWVALTAKHKHTCPNCTSDNYAISTGSPRKLTAFNLFFYLSFLPWLCILGLAFGLDYQLWDTTYLPGQGRNSTLCL
jgi:hypothetical protein